MGKLTMLYVCALKEFFLCVVCGEVCVIMSRVIWKDIIDQMSTVCCGLAHTDSIVYYWISQGNYTSLRASISVCNLSINKIV